MDTDMRAPGDAPNLILVGLPGAGKSTVGRAVAERLGRTFVDLDEEIARAEGMPIAEIFASQGEPAFRVLELKATERLRERSGLIISPGGGWMANPGAAALLRPPGRIIHLEVRPEVALERLASSGIQRPLLVGPDPLAELRRLLAARADAYAGADHVVNTELLSLQRVIEAVEKLASIDVAR